jgi:hypothetical protein
MIPAFILAPVVKLVGTRFAKPLAFITLAALLIGGLGLVKCQYDARKTAQARSDAKSAEAYATSAGEAVNAVAAAAGREAALKDVVTEAAKEIANAEGSNEAIPPAARAAALRSACRLPNYANHPTCTALLGNDP